MNIDGNYKLTWLTYNQAIIEINNKSSKFYLWVIL